MAVLMDEQMVDVQVDLKGPYWVGETVVTTVLAKAWL